MAGAPVSGFMWCCRVGEWGCGIVSCVAASAFRKRRHSHTRWIVSVVGRRSRGDRWDGASASIDQSIVCVVVVVMVCFGALQEHPTEKGVPARRPHTASERGGAAWLLFGLVEVVRGEPNPNANRIESIEIGSDGKPMGLHCLYYARGRANAPCVWGACESGQAGAACSLALFFRCRWRETAKPRRRSRVMCVLVWIESDRFVTEW